MIPGFLRRSTPTSHPMHPLSRPLPTAVVSSVSYLIVAIYAASVGFYLRPNILGDDAAITFRYVARLVAGQGLTYNNHEHILGTSNPLYAIILALLTATGIPIELAARGLALALLIAAALLTVYLTMHLSASRIAALVAGLLLVTDSFFRYQALSGMESILAVVLGLLVVIAILQHRPIAAGIMLGLAVWNKLDAAALALAVTIAWVLIRQTFPIKIALISIAVILPWSLFATWYYGSPIPHSFIAKSQIHAGLLQNFNHAWVIAFLLNDFRFLFVLGAVASIGFFRQYRQTQQLSLLTLFFWFLLHAIAFSLVNLGGYYPWYLTALVPPTIILTCTFAGRLLTREMVHSRKLLLSLGALLILGLATVASTRTTYITIVARNPIKLFYDDVVAGNPIKPFEAFDNDRRLAGIFLDHYADPSEIISSGFGWVAFEVKNPFDDGSQLNSNHMLEPIEYLVYSGDLYMSGAHPPAPPPAGFIPLATFNLASDLFPGYSWFTVFGRPDSKTARSGVRYLQYRLFELPPPSPWSPDGLKYIKIQGIDLQAVPPSGATFSVANDHQPVHVVFTPAFNPTVPVDKTDGVTFEIWNGQVRRYQRHLLPTEPTGPVILDIPDARNAATLPISFVTTPGPAGNANYDWAVWRSVKIIVGDALLDVGRMRNQTLIDAWNTHNLHTSSDAAPQFDGYLDRVNCTQISGWAWNKTQPNTSVMVEISFDSTFLITVAADYPRPDLAAHGMGTGTYGFAFAIPAKLRDGQPHAVRATIAGTNIDLPFWNTTPKSITCPPT